MCLSHALVLGEVEAYGHREVSTEANAAILDTSLINIYVFLSPDIDVC